MDREKVIGHLWILRTWCAVNSYYGMGLDVEDCGKAVGWLDDAIWMMKAEGEGETTSSVTADAVPPGRFARPSAAPEGEGSGEAPGVRRTAAEVQRGGTTMTCKWLSDDFSAICVNAACPACADACPCLNYQEICRYGEEGIGETGQGTGENDLFRGPAGPFSLKTAHRAVFRALEPPEGEGSVEAQGAVVHGRWEDVEDIWGDTHYRCSVCNCEWFLEDGTPAENGMKYCPRCGAKMDGERRDGA